MVLLFFHSCRRRRRQQTVPPRPPGPRLPSFLHLAESTPFSCAGSMLLPPPATIAATIAATTAATTAATIAATIGTIVTAVSSADPPPLPLALRANGPTRSFSFIFILPCTPFFAISPPPPGRACTRVSVVLACGRARVQRRCGQRQIIARRRRRRRRRRYCISRYPVYHRESSSFPPAPLAPRGATALGRAHPRTRATDTDTDARSFLALPLAFNAGLAILIGARAKDIGWRLLCWRIRCLCRGGRGSVLLMLMVVVMVVVAVEVAVAVRGGREGPGKSLRGARRRGAETWSGDVEGPVNRGAHSPCAWGCPRSR
jgi:hypothetical protein